MNWKPSRIFFGWWVVTACFLIWLLESGFVNLGFTAFFEPIADELGWSYTQISVAISLRGMEVGILAPLLGIVVDRWGPRRLIFSGIVIVTAGFMLLSYTNSLGMFYSAFVLIAIGMSCTSPTVGMTATTNWFRRKLSIAIGITASGFALGGLLVPVVVSLIDIAGWRTALSILGLVILLIGLPLSLLFRHKPEQYGSLPDGEQMDAVTLPEDIVSTHTGGTGMAIRQALKNRAFWHVGVAMAIMHLDVSAVILHVMPYLSTVSITRSISSLVALGIPLISIIGRLGSGWLGDRLGKRRITSGCLALLSLGLLLFSYASNDVIWLLVPFIILFGIGWGGTTTMRVPLLVEYFGRNRFGTTLGFIMAMSGLGSIAGPLFAGWIFDIRGSYQSAWQILALLGFIATIIIVTMPRTGKQFLST